MPVSLEFIAAREALLALPGEVAREDKQAGLQQLSDGICRTMGLGKVLDAGFRLKVELVDVMPAEVNATALGCVQMHRDLLGRLRGATITVSDQPGTSLQEQCFVVAHEAGHVLDAAGLLRMPGLKRERDFRWPFLRTLLMDQHQREEFMFQRYQLSRKEIRADVVGWVFSVAMGPVLGGGRYWLSRKNLSLWDEDRREFEALVDQLAMQLDVRLPWNFD